MSPVRTLILAMAVAAAAATPSGAASKRIVALLGRAAPGGGVFVGPGFGSAPAAAGAGWVAFRAQIVNGAGTTTEQLVAVNVATSERGEVARLGQRVSDTVGSLKELLGRPAINARGDVAFVATLNAGPETPQQAIGDPALAGVFLKRRGQPLEVVALAGSTVGDGKLDLATPVELAGDDVGAIDIPERTPALDDAATVSFLSSVANGRRQQAAILTRAVGQEASVVVRSGDPWAAGTFALLGPPVASPAGALAFRATVEGETALDGLFRVATGQTSLMLTAGFPVTLPGSTIEQPVEALDGALAINDAGDVAFTAGPLLDVSDSTTASDAFVPGVFVHRAGTTTLVAWPGQPIEGLGRVSAFALGPEFGGQATPPALTADGALVVHAVLNDGAFAVILRAEPPAMAAVPVLILGGATASSAPDGGTFLAASTPLAVDAEGAVAFAARIAGAGSSEALVFVPRSGPAVAIQTLGQAAEAPVRGIYGGPAFFPPRLNDAGTVVFKSYVAQGASGLGIFRSGPAGLESVVRIGDTAPVEGSPPPRFVDLPGDPSLGPSGDVAFAALLDNGRRGVFLATPAGIRPVAVARGDFADPERPGARYRAVAPNPVVLDGSEAVVFRATIEYPDPDAPGASRIVEQGIFASDASGARLLLAEGRSSPEGRRYYKFRDPSAAGTRVAFRAQLGTDSPTGEALFLLDPSGVTPVAVARQQLSDGTTLRSFSGRPAVDASGTVAFTAQLSGARAGQALLRGVAGGVAPVVVAGEAAPAGGRFRSLGRPALGSNGHLVFRATFEPFTGGTTSLFLSTPGVPLRPYLVAGESAPDAVGGRITTINQTVAVAADDRVAVLAGIAGGNSRSGIFLTSRADLDGAALRVRVRPAGRRTVAPRDRVRVRATLRPGSTSEGLDPAKAGLTVTLSDATRTLWTGTVRPSALVRRGRTYRARSSGKDGGLQAVRVQVGRDGGARVAATSSLQDLTYAGAAPLVPPLTVRVEIGADSALATLPCTRKGAVWRCDAG